MLFWLTALFIPPLMTMRLLAEEKRSGTIELLITMPITDGQIVMGKFFGALGFLTIMLASTLIFPLPVELLRTFVGGRD